MPNFHRIILPDSGRELIRPELALAFESMGCAVSRVHPDFFRMDRDGSAPKVNGITLEDVLADGPSLILSLNFQGLGSLRRLMELAVRHGAKIAAWCVDNPWNLLSGMRDPAWTELPLFISDDSFIPQLARHGAGNVRQLPLAASPEIFSPDIKREQAYPVRRDLAPFVFVGRSEFPGRDEFFKNMSIPDELRDEAGRFMATGGRPDFFWWRKNFYGKEQVNFWPGKRARPLALGAEEAAASWRGKCLAQASKAGASLSGSGTPGLDIFGDAGWKKISLQNARLNSPVDYYTRLPVIYRKSRFSLCLASMQLPHGLTQRHFDVWMAGGVGLTDASPGLALFPEELVRPVRFSKPEEILSAAERAESFSGGREALIEAWRQHILEKHTYRHRAEELLQVLGRLKKSE